MKYHFIKNYVKTVVTGNKIIFTYSMADFFIQVLSSIGINLYTPFFNLSMIKSKTTTEIALLSIMFSLVPFTFLQSEISYNRLVNNDIYEMMSILLFGFINIWSTMSYTECLKKYEVPQFLVLRNCMLIICQTLLSTTFISHKYSSNMIIGILIICVGIKFIYT